VKGYITDILTDYAIRFIKKDRDKPFCLFLWHKAVHAPFVPSDCDRHLYKDELLPEPGNYEDDYSDKPKWVRRGAVYGLHKDKWNASEGKRIPDKVEPLNWDPKNKKMFNYLRAISAVDRSIGNIDNTLRQEGVFDDTFMMFTSDNGYLLGEHHSVIDKRVMWEESIRVPLLARYPRVTSGGRIVKKMILNLDFMPTTLELAGAEIPATVQGRSFAAFLEGRDVAWRDSFFYEYFQEDYAPGIPSISGVRTERYKYIETPCTEGDIFELYDLKTDPLELNNLAGKSDKSMVLISLQQKLHELKDKYGYSVTCP
jgi:N-acetylglucosamine-6-sulfatase